jgi:hypothetical protein
MKILITICAMTVAFSPICFTSGSPIKTLDQVSALSATLNSEGIEEMLVVAERNTLDCPWIPDRWHVENKVKNPEVTKLADASREFGVKLAKELEKCALDFQAIPPSEPLLEKSMLMCELAEWVSKPVGIGNLLLTGRCLDLASVGLGRLVADIDFPLESCQTLAGKIQKGFQLIDVPRRAEVLDFEYGETFFRKCRSDDDLQWAWMIGAQRDGVGKKSFFVRIPYPILPTVANLIQTGGNHQIALAGVRRMSMTKALGLLDFRREIGYFPKPWMRSEEEWERLNKEITEAAKWGRKITPEEKSPSFDPLREAFQRTWREKVPDIKRNNDYIDAYYAYKEIMEGKFFDEDTRMIRLNQEVEQRRQERFVESQKEVEGNETAP